MRPIRLTSQKTHRLIKIIIAAVLLLCAVGAVLYFTLLAPEASSPEETAAVVTPTPTPTVRPTPTPVPDPRKVTGLNAVIDGKSVMLIWDEVGGADGYRITVTETESGETVYSELCDASLLTINDLDLGTDHSVSVAAFVKVDGRELFGPESDAVQTKSAEVISTPEPTPAPTPKPTPKPTPAPSSAKYLIKVNKAVNTVTVYKVKDGTETAQKVFLCSCGTTTPEGSFSIPNKWRWLWMVDDSYGQWVTQIKGDYLFHSVPYWGTKDPLQLDVGEYNKLGTTCSHGCVRLRAGDAKWIYDNIPMGTEVIIYSDANDPGPLGIPTVDPLPDWHTWDPTDPTVNERCREKGCH